MNRPKRRLTVFALLHGAAFVALLLETFLLSRIITTGHEGGWLTRIYVSGALILFAGGNGTLGITAAFRRERSLSSCVWRAVFLAASLIAGLWPLAK